MQIYSEKAVFIGENKEIAIDPSIKKIKAKHVFISHAHTDHARLLKEPKHRYLMTKETNDLIKSRYDASKRVTEVKFGKKIPVNGTTVSLHNSGHILGSSQFLIEAPNKRIVFTSDFKLQDSIIQKGAEILKADILIIESMFGLPAYKFPEREKIYSEMQQWIKQQLDQDKFVVLAGYSVGKAQELTKFVNEYLGITPLVYEKIFNANKAYESNGVKLGNYIKLNHNLNESNVLILPPVMLNPYLLQAVQHSVGRKVVSALATGWINRKSFSKIFPLSDHADFEQLIQYIKESKAKTVLTHHGFSRDLANYARRKLKVNARCLKQTGQQTLNEFS